MSHFLLIPTNENGVLLDPYFVPDVEKAMGPAFAFSHMFVYSHGWWTTGNRAMNEYNRFSLEFAEYLASAGQAGAPASAFAVGVHWPSMLSEDDGSPSNYLEGTSFYTMEKRADTVGENGVYALLQRSLRAKTSLKHLVLLGHSFGCKVVCAALQKISEQAPGSLAGLDVAVVLMQAAFEADAFGPKGSYSGIASLNPRLLVTKSDKDKALQDLFPLAHKLTNLLGGRESAMGAIGPSDLGGLNRPQAISIDRGSKLCGTAAATSRLVVADLTSLHQGDPPRQDDVDDVVGNHSDVFRTEIYDLLAWFLFT